MAICLSFTKKLEPCFEGQKLKFVDVIQHLSLKDSLRIFRRTFDLRVKVIVVIVVVHVAVTVVVKFCSSNVLRI